MYLLGLLVAGRRPLVGLLGLMAVLCFISCCLRRGAWLGLLPLAGFGVAGRRLPMAQCLRGGGWFCLALLLGLLAALLS